MATSNVKIKGYKTVYLDVMIKDRFICQLVFHYCPIFKVTDEEVRKFVLENRPTLSKQKFQIFFSQNRVI